MDIKLIEKISPNNNIYFKKISKISELSNPSYSINLVKIQKYSENTNSTKPKKQSNLDLLYFESSNNETLNMSTQRKILASIKSSAY